MQSFSILRIYFVLYSIPRPPLRYGLVIAQLCTLGLETKSEKFKLEQKCQDFRRRQLLLQDLFLIGYISVLTNSFTLVAALANVVFSRIYSLIPISLFQKLLFKNTTSSRVSYGFYSRTCVKKVTIFDRLQNLCDKQRSYILQ